MRTVLSPIYVHRTVGTGRPPEAMINDCFPVPNLLAWTSALSSTADIRQPNQVRANPDSVTV
jgi:hypothetical protein